VESVTTQSSTNIESGSRTISAHMTKSMEHTKTEKVMHPVDDDAARER